MENQNAFRNIRFEECPSSSVFFGEELFGYGDFVNSDRLANALVQSETIEFNHISFLQELCMSRHCAFPTYMWFNKLYFGISWFTAVCSWGMYTTVGNGRNKRDAKKYAAHNMYDKIMKER